MRRRNRLLIAAAAVAGAGGAAAGLTALSSRSEGPLALTLDRVGVAVGSAEYRVRSRLRGPGRATDLAWFEPYRRDPARLREPDVVLLGAYDSGRTLDGVIRLEKAIATTFPLVQIYSAWGDKADQRFPLGMATAIWDVGSVPVLTWEPWLSDFENAKHPRLPLREARDKHGLAAVARGDYDFYIDAVAADVARFGRPVFIRFAHEMNDPYRYPWGPQNNTAQEFINAWRHVVERFRARGADNVLWVWSPHVAYKDWEVYYPGDGYVDWVATGTLNFGPIAQWSQWWTFDEIFGSKYPQLAAFGKPVMIAELGSLAVGGDRRAWYADALSDLPGRYPSVKAVLLFHAAGDQTVTYQKVNWTVADDSLVAGAIARAIEPWAPAPNGHRAERHRTSAPTVRR